MANHVILGTPHCAPNTPAHRAGARTSAEQAPQNDPAGAPLLMATERSLAGRNRAQLRGHPSSPDRPTTAAGATPAAPLFPIPAPEGRRDFALGRALRVRGP